MLGGFFSSIWKRNRFLTPAPRNSHLPRIAETLKFLNYKSVSVKLLQCCIICPVLQSHLNLSSSVIASVELNRSVKLVFYASFHLVDKMIGFIITLI